MAHIKSTIQLLTTIFTQNGCTEIKAEIFRLAKFDDDNAVAPVWHLLYELTTLCEFGKISCISMKDHHTNDKVVSFVKRSLWLRGFESADFARLPHDMSTGSRELLLALGWLMCHEDLVQRFMSGCTSPLENTADASLVPDGVSENTRELSSSQKWTTFDSPDMSAADRAERLLWLNNKLQLSLRGLLGMQWEWRNLVHKIHTATQGVSLSADKNHLSVLEVHMLRHPEILQKNLLLLERDNERLENMLKWKEVEDVFWKWMESVLEAKLEQKKVSAASSPKCDPSSLPNASVTAECHRLQCSQHRLQEAIVSYEAIVTHLEKLWKQKHSSVSDSQLDAVLTVIDSELSIQRTNLLIRQPSPRQQTAEPTFVWKPSNTLTASPDDGIPDIELEIKVLQSAVDELMSELQERQLKYTRQMHELAASVPNTACIAPIAKKRPGNVT